MVKTTDYILQCKHCLVLCAAKKSLSELRQLYFRMKDEIFGNARAGMAYNTEALEKILKDEMGEVSMNDVQYPRCVDEFTCI